MNFELYINGTLVTVTLEDNNWVRLEIGPDHVSHWRSVNTAVHVACKVLKNRRRAA